MVLDSGFDDTSKQDTRVVDACLEIAVVVTSDLDHHWLLLFSELCHGPVPVVNRRGD